ncbi:SpoIIE family protein phosphatase [Peredibacter starrii]|uniref:SpoIIE family protein phosphatase n=1 Tax=Peredibacter starrii TaxID=28202 RepID=A0AAX4HSV1_9BACT|nr:SpoIIE family protein phosphatase [Peredibacter starrii]WPU66183.1 SpoIIE family protein phosphatase [Peredibacter starrii]
MASTMRQVRFPLKLKLLTVMIVLIAASLIVFVGIALKTFKEDKSAYIFETLLSEASSEQIILSQKLGDGTFKIKNSNLVFNDADPVPLLKEQLEKESTYDVKIVIPEQTSFLQWKNGKLSQVSPLEAELLTDITKQSINQAVKEIKLDGVKYLYAYDYNPQLNYIYVVMLSQEKAFSVTQYLINKSMLYGVFILGMAMLLSVFLAKPLTAQLETLFGMTQEIAKGNFTKRVSIKGSDEVGALSDSVNDMADKIVVFMEEMKEKARLENEVQVAQLVQSSFFPTDSLSDNVLSTHGHFEPATECGGDWWGFYDQGDWRVFFIADATGHGVPAALLTATINCCKTLLGFIQETRPQILSEPNEILRFMNQAVCGAGKEIQVTCFVASFNRKTHEFKFSNASHTPPLLFNGGQAELGKDNFQPLIEANGPRLGQKLDSKFDCETLNLKTHDTIFFYTDGLTEAENAEGTRYGERRLIKSLVQHGLGSPEEIIKGVMGDFQVFISDKPKDDDLTAVSMKVIS